MIILDETRLRNGTLMMIGEDYDMKINTTEEEYVQNIVDRFTFDIDGFKEKLISAIINGIKIELKLK